VKERQDSLAARIADTISGGVRRRQQEREPRALVYDAGGEPHLVPPASEAHAALVETAEVLVATALDDAPADGADPDQDAGGE
jgi:hypothetical protein